MSDSPFAHARGLVGWPRASRLLALLGSLSAAVAFLAAAGPVQASPSAVAGHGSTVALAVAGHGPTAVLAGATGTVPPGAKQVGVERSSSIVHLDVVLSPRDPTALTRYATEVATPGSPLYHDYLPRGAFPSVFGPTRAAIAAVRSALSGLGLHPGPVSANHLAIPVTATAGQVESAFGIKLNRYRLADGRVGTANITAPMLPATAARYVESIIGLDTLIAFQPLLARPGKASARPSAGRPAPEPGPRVRTGGPQPCQSALNAQAAILNNSTGAQWVLTADQMAHTYEYDRLYHAGDFGQGQTIGIIELGESNLTSDIAAFQSCYGTRARVSYQNIGGFRPKGPGEGEAALDIETAIAMAPKAKVVVYRGQSNGNGWYDTFATAAAEDAAQVESVSYGLCELGFGQLLGKNLAGALNVIFEQQAVQGQTVAVSSGDTGSQGCLRVDPSQPGLLSAEFPGSDPFVLSVGGTSVTSATPVARQEEVVWNDGFDTNGAGGGGESVFFSEPSYQKGFGITFTGGTRGVPDVSADADPETGYLVWYSGGWIQVGGTSASAPLWTALMALTNAKCSSSPVGFANPAIYFAASPKVPAIVINDIRTDPSFPSNVSNDYTGQGGGQYPVANGYDMATGLGSPVGGALASQLCKTSTQAKGYRLVSADGHVYSFHAAGYGSPAHVKSRVAGIADDPKTNGYWVVTAMGHVQAFHAPFRGSVRGRLASPVVGIAADKAGTGYWLVTAKGHVYAFHAPFHGSVGGRLASPVVGIAADPFTGGYWVVTAKGKVYAFDAGRYQGRNLSRVTGIAADPRRQAYWLVTANGKVFGFNVSSQGSMPVGNLFGNVTGIAGDPASGGPGGYWLITSFGLVAGFNAEVHGAHPFQNSKNPMVGIASTH